MVINANVNVHSRRDDLPSGCLPKRNQKELVLITGGAGFIGTNLADRLMSAGHRVLVFDNLSRRGSEANLSWLAAKHPSLLEFAKQDVRDFEAVRGVMRSAFAVFHFAAQVAVTDSLANPRHDFDVNAGGTLQVLEAIRELRNPPVLLFTSTNKVYGALEDLELRVNGKRYLPGNQNTAENGISERRNLDFHSPYGCSKGAADQYILDYARTFHLPAVVFRMSCIYGQHQNGTEDQGWVAHFLIRASQDAPICIYGDGRQVRDVLFIEDLLDAFEFAVNQIDATAGQAFNIGGGVQNTVSLLELVDCIERMRGESCRIGFSDWRHADQRFYVSDTAKFASLTGWSPCIGVNAGLHRLQEWLSQEQEVLNSSAGQQRGKEQQLAKSAASTGG